MTESNICGETSQDGSTCSHNAGWGTDNDSGPCKLHIDADSNSIYDNIRNAVVFVGISALIGIGASQFKPEREPNKHIDNPQQVGRTVEQDKKNYKKSGNTEKFTEDDKLSEYLQDVENVYIDGENVEVVDEYNVKGGRNIYAVRFGSRVGMFRPMQRGWDGPYWSFRGGGLPSRRYRPVRFHSRQGEGSRFSFSYENWSENSYFGFSFSKGSGNHRSGGRRSFSRKNGFEDGDLMRRNWEDPQEMRRNELKYRDAVRNNYPRLRDHPFNE